MSLQDEVLTRIPPRDRSANLHATLSVSAAHEINNPLGSLFNLLHLLESEVKSEAGHHYLSLMEQELGRIAQIARKALDPFKASVQLEPTDIAKLVESVLEVYRGSFELKGINVHTRLQTASIPVFAGQLRQMLSNLLLNAMDAVPRGGQLNLRTSFAREWRGQMRNGVRVTVADNGSGIAPDHLSRIFERFFTTKGAAGSGMGLPLVKDIVQKHNGTLRVRSNTKSTGSGTVFSIFLPSASNTAAPACSCS